jgi:uncharacterized membrane protein YozB (DUF420 family)
VRLEAFPPLNATLNGTSAVLLLIAYVLIKRNHVRPHAWTMIAAVATSTAFLGFYLTYHARLHGKITRFPPSAWRPLYLTILTSHTILAAIIVPLVVTVLILAYRRSWPTHRRVARPTFWIWLYVSVTGVIIYWMLYHLAPTLTVAASR